MKIRRSILALGAFFVLGAGIAACGSGVPGDSVADVAGNPITTQAFNHWMYVAAKGAAAQAADSGGFVGEFVLALCVVGLILWAVCAPSHKAT